MEQAAIEAIRIRVNNSTTIFLLALPVQAWIQLNDADDWNDWFLGLLAIALSISCVLHVLAGRVWSVQTLIGETWKETHSDITREHTHNVCRTLKESFPEAQVYEMPFNPVYVFVTVCILGIWILLDAR